MNAPLQLAQFDQAVLSNIEVEQELLGAILHVGGAVLDAVEPILTPTDFAEPIHQTFYKHLVEQHAKGRAITLTLATAALGSTAYQELPGNVTVGQYLARLAAAASLPGRALDYAKQIREFAQRRQIVGAVDAIQAGIANSLAPEDIAGAGIAVLDDIAAAGTSIATRIDVGDAAHQALELAMQARDLHGEITGISTGLSDLDAKINGLHRGELLVIAGRPGMGKSAVGVCIATAVARAEPVIYFSLEMGAVSIANRALADLCFDHRDPIEYFRFARGDLNDAQLQRLVEAQRTLRTLPLVIEDQSGLTVSQIAARARKANQKLARQGKRLGAIIVDHLHLIKPSQRYSGNRVGEITEISGGLKTLAKELDVAVVALAQLNRTVENRDVKRPTLADLRDSGSIEQDSDTVVLLFRPAYYLETPCDDPTEEDRRIGRLSVVQHDLEANVAKQRSGPTGTVKLFCDIGANAIRNAAGVSR